MKKKRVLLVSCSVIMLCICIIAGMSYALFTDSVSVGNHLQAGNLKVTLTRTNLKYSVLNADGELAETTVEEDLDLTTSSDNNAFGIDSTNVRIVPGSYFDADLALANAGNTAFTYNISIKLLGTSTELAEQLKVTVTHPDGTTTEKMLSELANGLSVAVGEMQVTDTVQSFGVRVEFTEDAAYNANRPTDDRMNNNAAQDATAAFDLVVTATQATASN